MGKSHQLLYCIVCIVLYVVQVLCQADSASEERLHSKLFQQYSSRVKPNNITVGIMLSLISFDFLDESHEMVSAHVWLSQDWTDFRLQWDPADYDNTSELVVGADQIWLPDVELYNGISTVETLHSNYLTINDGGHITYWKSLHHNFICKMNLLYFPYDKQKCTLKYGSWVFTASQLNLTLERSSPYIGYLSKGSSADLILFEAEGKAIYTKYPCCLDTFVSIDYNFKLERYSKAYTAKLVIPSILAGLLILATFLVPHGSFERITFCGFLFLIFVLLLIYLQSLVPASGDTILGEYLAFAIFVNFFATIIAVASYNIQMWLKSKPGGGMIDAEGEDHMPTLPMGINTRWLRYLDISSFVLFTFVFIIGVAVILGRRG